MFLQILFSSVRLSTIMHYITLWFPVIYTRQYVTRLDADVGLVIVDALYST